MANPQPDRYTRFSNELLEALARIRVSGEARQILDVVFRKTYGFNKKEDKISLSQFALATGLPRPLVVRGVSKLITLNILIIKKDNTYINIYKINKDFDTWKPLSKKIRGVSKKIMTVIKKDNLLLSKKIHTKDTLTKDTLTKESICLSTKKNFEDIWNKYPNRVGRKAAETAFSSSVKTEQDITDINTALVHYLASERVSNGFVQNGGTWFRNWRDWVVYTEPVCPKCKGKGRYASPTGYGVTCDCPAGKRLKENVAN